MKGRILPKYSVPNSAMSVRYAAGHARQKTFGMGEYKNENDYRRT